MDRQVKLSTLMGAKGHTSVCSINERLSPSEVWPQSWNCHTNPPCVLRVFAPLTSCSRVGSERQLRLRWSRCYVCAALPRLCGRTVLAFVATNLRCYYLEHAAKRFRYYLREHLLPQRSIYLPQRCIYGIPEIECADLRKIVFRSKPLSSRSSQDAKKTRVYANGFRANFGHLRAGK